MFALAVQRCCIGSSSFFQGLARILPRGQQKAQFQRRVEAIDWSQYQTAYGSAVTVPSQLTRLVSEDTKEALSASHDLWCGLCHQHVIVGSAAQPALPFLLEVMDRANDLLVVEILDILLGFAICTNPVRIAEFYAHPLAKKPVPNAPWIASLREALRAELPRFRALESAHDEDVANFAKQILTELA